MTGSALYDLGTELNGGAAIGGTLYFQLLNVGKAIFEQRRPWMILRKTDTSKTVTTGNTWQTAIDLSSITNFDRFNGEFPIRLFDGANNIERFRQVPFEERLYFKDVPNTFVYDENGKTLYLNGPVSFGGTLYINHLITSADIENDDGSSWLFPSWSHALLAFMAVGIHKGGVDYDDINARMSPENKAAAEAIVRALETQDAAKQVAARESYDQYADPAGGFRGGAIDMNA
jgi:hypothetical protein